MATDYAQFITGAAPYLQTSVGSLKMQKAILASLKGFQGALVHNLASSLPVALRTFKTDQLSEDQLMAARINTWLSVLNTNLGAGISTNINNRIALAKQLAQLDDHTLGLWELYAESSTLFAHIA